MSVTVAGLLVCAPLAACGDGGSGDGGDQGGGDRAGGEPSPGVETVRSAYETSAREGTAAFTLEVTTEAGSEKATVNGEGVLDFASGESRMTASAQGTELEQRVVDGVFYQRQGQDGSEDARWLKADLAELARSQGASGGARPHDPAASAEYAKAVSDEDVKEVGTEQVGGVDTTHYQVSVDVSELARANEQAAGQLEQRVGDTLPMELWLDDDGLIRRQRVDLTVRPPQGASASAEQAPEKAKVSMVMEFDDYGTDVSVEAPPTDQTTPMPTPTS
ncbi:hypothetical protein WDH52_18050 [Streptomyces sp. TRM70308]|uniref:DUF7537 family lipoprotein n=1 Tax=Streptomyces sp. TRM70308 TaxID=3131932 RepID=UPI003CFDF142